MAVGQLIPFKPATERIWPRDEFERTLLEARALLEETLSRHRERAERRHPVAALDAGEVSVPKAAQRLYARATASVDVILGRRPADAANICTALAETAAEAAPGVQVRVLFGRPDFEAGLVPGDGGAWA